MFRHLSHKSSARQWPAVCLIAAVVSLSQGCDPERKKRCEWYLMPNTDKKANVDKGFISVCARNLMANKEDCRLQTTLSFAKKVYGKTFRYVDLKVKSFGIPRTIQEMTFCTPEDGKASKPKS